MNTEANNTIHKLNEHKDEYEKAFNSTKTRIPKR